MDNLKCPQEEVLKDYPDAKRILNARARKLMKENEERLAKEMSEQQKQKQKQKAQQHDLKQDEIVELVSSDKVGINVKFVHYFAISRFSPNGGIRTADAWCHTRPFYRLCRKL